MKRCLTCNFINIDSDDICFECGATLLEDLPESQTLESTKETPKPTSSSSDELVLPYAPLENGEPLQPTKSIEQSISPKSNPTKELLASLKVDPSKEPSSSAKAALSSDMPNAQLKEDVTNLFTRPHTDFDTSTNISAFIHRPTFSTPPSSTEGASTRTESGSKGATSLEDSAASEAAATSMPFTSFSSSSFTSAPLPSLSKPARIIPKYKSLKCLKVLSELFGTLFGLALIAVGVLLIFVYPGLLGVASCIGFVGMGVLSIFLGFVLSSMLVWLNDVECNQRKQIELVNYIYHKMKD